MKLEAYLDRIGYRGSLRPDEETLRAIHRAHAESIPYENLDVQFRRPVSRRIAPIYEKLVSGRRGGWCYEMNGLLAWALEECGFKVSRLAGAVMRETAGDAMIGNHLVLLVDLGLPWLADAGFGDGLIEPVPLKEGAFPNGVYHCKLERNAEGWWRYSNDPRGSAPSFDFHPDYYDESMLEERCAYLQSSPDSPFVQNAVVQIWRNDAHYSLRGRVLQRTTGETQTQHLVSDADEYVATLRETFCLDAPDAASLWPVIVARHEALFSSEQR